MLSSPRPSFQNDFFSVLTRCFQVLGNLVGRHMRTFLQFFQSIFLPISFPLHQSIIINHFVEPPFEKSGKISGEKNLLKLDPNE